MVGWAGLAYLICLAPFVQAASAQSYPERLIRVIPPNPAGGSNDTVVRIIATKMSTPQEFAAFVRDQLELHRQPVKDVNLTISE